MTTMVLIKPKGHRTIELKQRAYIRLMNARYFFEDLDHLLHTLAGNTKEFIVVLDNSLQARNVEEKITAVFNSDADIHVIETSREYKAKTVYYSGLTIHFLLVDDVLNAFFDF